MELSYAHGVFPLVYHALKTHKELMPSNILTHMKMHNMDIARKNMLMTSELIKVMQILVENEIQALSYKGPLLSQMIHKDITLRQYVDLDILVDEKQLSKTVELLKKHNYLLNEEEYIQITNNKSIFHDISLHTKNGVHIELHWRLFSDEFKTGIGGLDIWKNLVPVDIMHTSLHSFKIEVLVLYLCIHGAKHNWERVEWLLDVVKLLQNYKVDLQKLLAMAQASQSEKILLSTLHLSQKILDPHIAQELQTQLEQKHILKLSKQFEEHFYSNFANSLTQKVATKKVSKVQFNSLEGYKNKLSFIVSLMKPTELEFQTIQLPKHMYFLYYIIRPFNIAKRWIKKL